MRKRIICTQLLLGMGLCLFPGLTWAGLTVSGSYGRDSLYLGEEFKHQSPTGHHYGARVGLWWMALGAEVGGDRVELEDQFVSSNMPVVLNVRVMNWYGGILIPFFTPFTHLRAGLTMQKFKGRINGDIHGVDNKTTQMLERVNGSRIGAYVGLGAHYAFGPWQIHSEGNLYKPRKLALFQWGLGVRYFF